jgi:NDP-sugar pyrophosphorylase family protein
MGQAIILAGGKGTRLMPFSATFPKPLVPLGDKPVLEILIRRLASAGFCELVLAVGHLSHLIQAYFGDGSRFGVSITYSLETEPLGTAGPLALIDCLHDHFLVLNGDLLTNLDFNRLEQTLVDSKADLTVATYRKKHQVDLGVLDLDNCGKIVGYNEKPVFDYHISMGAYAFKRTVVTDFLTAGKRTDLPDLVMKLVNGGMAVNTWIHEGFWLDIGRPEDYATAQQMYEKQPDYFLSQTDQPCKPVTP